MRITHASRRLAAKAPNGHNPAWGSQFAGCCGLRDWPPDVERGVLLANKTDGEALGARTAPKFCLGSYIVPTTRWRGRVFASGLLMWLLTSGSGLRAPQSASDRRGMGWEQMESGDPSVI